MDSKEFNTLIKEFELIHDQKGRPLEMHSLLVKDKETYLHHFRKEKEMSDVRSISKTVLTLVLGRVIQLSVEGKYSLINEETFIYPIIKNQFNLKNEENLEKIKRIKIKHLLTHTIGFEDVLMMREDIRDMDPFNYVNYILNYPLIYEPGDYYLYSNAGFYLLSVVLEEFIQEDLTQFLKREFFNLLGIKKFTWEKYGDYLAGAT
ncbi:MAG: beta-lactamase family protein, partial [Atopostipes sp.]|nr:beta-lactamase family protein [Atopostipes sp.]